VKAQEGESMPDFTTAEVAARLHVSRATLARRIADGTAPPSYKLGSAPRSARRFPAGELERWIADQAHVKAARSRAKQGLGPTITDRATLEKVAAMVAEILADREPAPKEEAAS
jgi:predicted DNA-binding transcriptional regulator AlpA